MRYIVITKAGTFYTAWYSEEMHGEEMTVIDLENDQVTNDGINWNEIEQDHL